MNSPDVPRSNVPRYVPLASIAKPQGVTGELRLKVYNEQTELLVKGQRVRLLYPDGRTDDSTLSGVRRVNKGLLVRLQNVEDRDAAELLRGVEICLRRDAFPPVDDGEFYAVDIEGAVAELADGSRIGTVRQLASYPTCDVLVVDAEGGSLEVPLTEHYVDNVDTEGHRVVLRTLEGLE